MKVFSFELSYISDIDSWMLNVKSGKEEVNINISLDDADELKKLGLTQETIQLTEHKFPYLTNERRKNLLVGAVEGGSNYWYYLGEVACNIIDKYDESHADCFVDKMWRALEAGETIPVHDAEDEVTLLGNISLQSIEQGERLMIEKHAAHFADVLSENDDAITADVWFQLAVLAELTYG